VRRKTSSKRSVAKRHLGGAGELRRGYKAREPQALIQAFSVSTGRSVLDAGWSMLKTMLEYKGAHAGIVVREVNESFSTQVCSCCGSISDSSPKGRAGLRIREWTCVACGSTHDRDINAARNILGRGRAPLAVGISVLPRVSGQPTG